ncbi:21203_t:CDS:2, partial [Dentiscutata erythropus]
IIFARAKQREKEEKEKTAVQAEVATNEGIEIVTEMNTIQENDPPSTNTENTENTDLPVINDDATNVNNANDEILDTNIIQTDSLDSYVNSAIVPITSTIS